MAGKPLGKVVPAQEKGSGAAKLKITALDRPLLAKENFYTATLLPCTGPIQCKTIASGFPACVALKLLMRTAATNMHKHRYLLSLV